MDDVASPLYHARGLAALRPDAAGEIILDQGLSRQPKILRIRVEDDGRITSTSGSTLDQGSSQNIGTGIEALIRRARDSLFEEELFHELLREVRAELLSFRVAVEDHIIRVPVEAHRAGRSHNSQQYILIDLVDRDDHQEAQSQSEELNKDPYSTTSFISPNCIVLALRILLTQTYRQRFRKRSQPPPPISEEKRSAPVHSILRPVIAYIQHAEATRGLHEFTSHVLKVLESAGVAARYAGRITTSAVSHLPFDEQSNQSSNKTPSMVEFLLSTVDGPLKAQATLSIPSYSSKQEYVIAIDTTTHFSAPTFGTLFHITPPQFNTSTTSGLAPGPEPLRYHNFDSLTKYITYLVCRAVASSNVIPTVSSTADSNERPQGWRLEDSGTDLRRVWMTEEKVRRLSVVWQDGGLIVVCAENGVRAKMVGWWDGGKNTERKQTTETLREVVESCGQLVV